VNFDPGIHLRFGITSQNLWMSQTLRSTQKILKQLLQSPLVHFFATLMTFGSAALVLISLNLYLIVEQVIEHTTKAPKIESGNQFRNFSSSFYLFGKHLSLGIFSVEIIGLVVTNSDCEQSEQCNCSKQLTCFIQFKTENYMTRVAVHYDHESHHPR